MQWSTKHYSCFIESLNIGKPTKTHPKMKTGRTLTHLRTDLKQFAARHPTHDPIGHIL